jgi:hypothetical protein
MERMFRLSRRQTTALTLLLGVGLSLAWARAGAAAPTTPEPPVWTARVSFMQVNQAALVAAPGLSPADVRLRLRQIAQDSTAPWVAYRRQVAWTPAREAVIARYVSLHTPPSPHTSGTQPPPPPPPPPGPHPPNAAPPPPRHTPSRSNHAQQAKARSHRL